jgi:hypothetical protein
MYIYLIIHMKAPAVISVFLICSMTAFSQAGINPQSTSQEFATMVQRHSSTSTIQSFSSGQMDGSQFFLPEWQRGEVVMNDNEVFSSGLLFIYDKVRQELFIRQKDSSFLLQANKDDINRFNLRADGRQYNFVNSARFSESRPAVYYQVLVEDSAGLSFFKFTKANFEAADRTDMMKMREGAVLDAYVDKITYYIVKGRSEPKPVQLKMKSVKQVMGELGVDTEAYIKSHPGSVNEDWLAEMVRQLNQSGH